MLRLSVIIPTWNEESVIAPTIAALHNESVHEIIVADGGSTDETLSIAREAGAKVVRSQPGRGTQLNTGASHASGDVFLFLHADTLVPSDLMQAVEGTLNLPGVAAGAFGLSIDGGGKSLRVIERTVEWRSRFLRRPYGDQGLFMTAEMFRRVGGYAEIPVMEDYEIIPRLRRHGRIALASTSVTTSARRWQRRGAWRTTLMNQLCIVAFRAGVSPRRIAHWRNAQLVH